jgi:hypothetical protein
MTLAAKAKLGLLYLNAKEAVYLWQILIEMGHPQTYRVGYMAWEWICISLESWMVS